MWIRKCSESYGYALTVLPLDNVRMDWSGGYAQIVCKGGGSAYTIDTPIHGTSDYNLSHVSSSGKTVILEVKPDRYVYDSSDEMYLALLAVGNAALLYLQALINKEQKIVTTKQIQDFVNDCFLQSPQMGFLTIKAFEENLEDADRFVSSKFTDAVEALKKKGVEYFTVEIK